MPDSNADLVAGLSTVDLYNGFAAAPDRQNEVVAAASGPRVAVDQRIDHVAPRVAVDRRIDLFVPEVVVDPRVAVDQRTAAPDQHNDLVAPGIAAACRPLRPVLLPAAPS